MKLLVSKVSQVTLPFFHQTDITMIDREVNLYEIHNIAETVNFHHIYRRKNYPELEASILSGMLNPIVIMKNNTENYTRALQGMNNTAIAQGFYPKKQYICLFGNQRLAVAAKHGYTHISCVFCVDINKAIVIGNHFEGSYI